MCCCEKATFGNVRQPNSAISLSDQDLGISIFLRQAVSSSITNGDVEVNLGDVLTVEKFESGQKIDVIGTSKGRGFQGVVKRYGFAGGPASHGSMFHRRGGSYGMCQWPGHVIKGKKMPGHMGDVRRTVQNLEIVKIIAEENLILVKGSIPGSRGSLVTVRTAVKTKRGQA